VIAAFVFLALTQTETLAVHLQEMHMVGQAVENSTCNTNGPDL
jgi:hypothetical protein